MGSTTTRRARQADGAAGRGARNPHAQRMQPEEFRRCVKDFYGTKTLVFDKAFAEEALAFNTGNRRVNARKLAQLVRQMQAGEFENTGEPVIVSKEGILNNGQHRLLAVVEADAVVDMDVRFGIPRKVFAKTDTGAPRTGGDVLTIEGIAAGQRVSSAVRLLVLYERGLPEAIREFVSNDEILQAFTRWKDLAEVVRRVGGFSFPKSVLSTPLVATAFLASRSAGEPKLGSWLETLASGVNAGRDDPAYQLRERLVRGVDAPIGTREGQLERFALMIKSWNLFQAGKHVHMREFRWKPDGRNAEPFPAIDGARL